MAKPLTVTEVSKYISNLMKRDPILSNVYLEGEVSNFKKSNGNVYFSLKDKDSMIRCVIFRNMELSKNCNLSDGEKIIAKGSIITYAQGSNYQILVKSIELSGEGDIYKQYELLKQKLAKEGLFDQIHKKEIPSFPKCIGVVTSPTGAAIRDIITTIKRRYPICDIILYPAIVQGENAPNDIISGLEYLDELDSIDLIIFGRGGGSFEDLNAFNDEELIRAVFEMKTPTISAVGHEIDNMLSDYVADMRAPTPTAAAEISTPDVENILSRFEEVMNRMHIRIKSLIKGEYQMLDHLESTLDFYNPKEKIKNLGKEIEEKKAVIIKYHLQYLKNQSIKLDHMGELLFRSFSMENIYRETVCLEESLYRLQSLILQKLKLEDVSIDNKLEKLKLINPKNILDRGYARIYHDEKLVHSTMEVNIKDKIKIVLSDGILFSEIEEKETFNG